MICMTPETYNALCRLALRVTGLPGVELAELLTRVTTAPKPMDPDDEMERFIGALGWEKPAPSPRL